MDCTDLKASHSGNWFLNIGVNSHIIFVVLRERSSVNSPAQAVYMWQMNPAVLGLNRWAPRGDILIHIFRWYYLTGNPASTIHIERPV